MKKTVFAIAVGALAVCSTANAHWYAQADVGFSQSYISIHAGDTIKENANFEPRLAVGYDFGNWRLAGDYTYHGETLEVSTLGLKTHSVGVSALWDFNVSETIQPYVGARVAYVHASATALGYSFSSGSLGYGVLAGGSYYLNPKTALNLGLEYNILYSYMGDHIGNYGAKVGIRYEF